MRVQFMGLWPPLCISHLVTETALQTLATLVHRHLEAALAQGCCPVLPVLCASGASCMLAARSLSQKLACFGHRPW